MSNSNYSYATEHLDEESPLLTNDRPTQKDNGTIKSNRSSDDEVDPSIVEGEGGEDEGIILAEEPSTAKLFGILLSIWFGVFLAALDGTLIATLSGPISGSFNSLSLLSWLASAYFIANAALQPLSGRLTDILSRRTGLVFSNVFFAIGNLICGLANAEWVIILGRVVAGMGGGGLTAISTIVTTDLVPLRKRGVWQGFGNIFFSVGGGLGGIFGGWINDVWGWRVAFLVQVPLTILSGIVVFFTVKIPVKETGKSPWKRIDFLGCVTLVTSVVLLLVGLNSGGNTVPWTDPLVLTSLPLSAAVLCLFIWIEAFHPEPIIPVRLLLDRTVMAGCLTNWFSTMAIFALFFYGPIYFQILGASATAAGLRLVPQSIGGGIGSLGSGLIMRKTGRYYWLGAISMAILIGSCAGFSTLTRSSSEWVPFIYFFLEGLAYGGMLTVTLLALIAAVPHEHQAVITSASYAFRSTGSTIGITIASAVFQNILKMGLWAELGDKKGGPEVIPKVRDSLDEIWKLSPDWREAVLRVYMEALRAVFLTTLGLAVLATVTYVLVREHKLYSTLSRK
ncbi:MAG: hypothetical protein M1834_008331 [Cirrosporium novae-zelandiae]|nr:MAG: hypothetical protein M1834_008331 [Cirrosporium novae-zelandiae]